MAFRLPLYIQTPTPSIAREYIASDTWTKPSGLRELIVVGIGAGGGGGGGALGATTVNNNGGKGGGGGFVVVRRILASELTGSTYSITIGAGGAGGAGRLNANGTGDGAVGSIGGNTSFTSGSDTLVEAIGGWGGARGRTNNNAPLYAGTLITNCIPRLGINIQVGDINTANLNTNGASANGLNGNGPPQGGQGGNRPANSNATQNGLAGGGTFNGTTLVAGGTTIGGNGADDVATGLLLEVPYSGVYGVGTAAGGGRTLNQTSNGENGGNGGRCAGGGGGAGACTGYDAGNAGNGGSGYLVLLEMY